MRKTGESEVTTTPSGCGGTLQDKTNLISDNNQLTPEKKVHRKRANGRVFFRTLNRNQSLTQGKKICEFDPSDPIIVGTRKLVMEGLVQFSQGSVIKDRCIFLYNDILIVAKQKSHDKFNLKERIKLSEVWLDLENLPLFLPNLPCLHPLSFIIGWPSSPNVVAIFTSKSIRDIWFQVLQNHIFLMKEREKASIPVKIALDDESFSITKSLMVSNRETTTDLIDRCVSEFRLKDKNASGYQMHVSYGNGQDTRLLCGFENPFSIYTNLVRNSVSCNARETKFLLKSRLKNQTPDQKSTSKNKLTLLKRMLSKGSCQGKLFGRDLNELITENNKLSPVLMNMLGEIYVNGSISTGIFRKTASQAVRNIKIQLDSGDESVLENVFISDMAALFKEFLRSMSDCLLTSSLYYEWMKATSCSNKETLLLQIKSLVARIPSCNLLLLRHLMCVLNSVTQSSDQNLMTPYNLAVCISQCILWPAENNSSSSAHSLSGISSSPSCSSLEQYNDINKMNFLVQFLIENTSEIFGQDCLKLFEHLSEQRSSVLASVSNLSQRSTTDSDGSQTSITVSPKPKYGFLKTNVPKLKQLYSKRGLYASTPSLIPFSDMSASPGSITQLHF